MKLKLYFLVFLAYYSNTKSQNIIGLGSGGKHNSGVFFKINPKTCESEAIFHFDAAPISGTINSLQFVDGEIYGASSKGGDKNHGVIFKYCKEDSLFKILHSFADSLPYTPLYFIENQSKFYMVSLLQNQIRDGNSEFCPKYDCWKYLFTEFSMIDDSLKVTNQKAELFYYIEWFEKLDNNRLLIQHHNNKILSLNFDNLEIKKVFNLHKRTGLNVHEQALKIGSIRFLPNDNNVYGVFEESVWKKSNKYYNYTYDFKNDNFTFAKLNDEISWENINQEFRSSNYWSYSPRFLYFNHKSFVQIDNGYRKNGGFHIYNNELEKTHSIRIDRKNYQPQSVFRNDEKLYYFGYTTTNEGKELIALSEYDFEEKKYTNLFALEDFSVNPSDIYQYKQIDSLLYFYSYERLGYVNLKTGRNAILIKKDEDNKLFALGT